MARSHAVVPHAPAPPPVRRAVPAPSLAVYFAEPSTFRRSLDARSSSSAAPHSPIEKLTRRGAPEAQACQQQGIKKGGPEDRLQAAKHQAAPPEGGAGEPVRSAGSR